jgi:Rieske Fe-S protein
VHWEPGDDRFFCSCHNGVFDPQGKATSGPPAVEEQDLARYELKIENGLLFIKVPTDMGIA